MTGPSLAERLPDIPTLRRRCQALAMLDAVLCPEWEYRYYSYDMRWAPGRQLASMRNGSGDEYSIVFSPDGAIVRGFAHESARSPYRCDPPQPWPGLVEDVPAMLQPLLAPFHRDGALAATVVAWREPADETWHAPDPDDESEPLFGVLADPTPAAYHRFAQDYFEVPLDLAAVSRVFARAPLTQELVHDLTPHARLEDLIEDCASIGWAISGRVPLSDLV